MSSANPEVTQELAARLKSWLKEKDVKFPKKSGRYNAEKAVQELTKKQNVKGMEKKHLDYLSKDFKGPKNQRGNGYIED